MGEVATVLGGGTPSTTDPKNFDGLIPWITPADMSGYSRKTISRGARCISERGLEDSGARWLPEGAVLFSSRAPIGYVAIASRPVTTNQGFKNFVPSSGLNSDYIYYWLTSAKRYAEELASGTTFLEISGTKAALIPFPLASAAEQTRIVAKLEELLSDLDAGVAELKAAQKKLGQYRQSLLKAAVEGALTADWRSKHKPLETGAQLLERILTERRARWEAKQGAKFAEQNKAPPKDWQKKYHEPVQPDTTDLPELPAGWVWASVDQCSLNESAITDGPFGSNLKSSHYQESGPRVIRLQNIGEGVFYDAKSHILDSHYAELLKHSVQEGDLVIAMLGEILPRACIIPAGVAPAIVKADCARVRVNEFLIKPSILMSQLNSKPVRDAVVRFVKGIGRPRVNLGHLRAIPIALCSIAEQLQMEALLSDAQQSINRQNDALELAFKQATAQRQNILRAAFAGQLVPQNPNDEPASVLLERIRAERLERDTMKKPLGRKVKAAT